MPVLSEGDRPVLVPARPPGAPFADSPACRAERDGLASPRRRSSTPTCRKPHGPACRRLLPGGAGSIGQLLAGREPMTQSFKARHWRPEEPAVDPRRSGKDRRLMLLHQETERVRRHAVRGDQCGGAARPGIQKPRAEGVGPVERPGMQQAIVLGQPVPTVPHHAARPDGAMGMGDRAGLSRGARRIDDVAGAFRIAHRVGGGRVLIHGPHGPSRQNRAGRFRGKRKSLFGHDKPRRDIRRDLRHLRRGQERGGRNRDNVGRQRGEIADRELQAVAEPHEQAIAGAQTFGDESARSSQNGRFELRIAPAFRARRGDHRERGLACELARASEHIGREIKRSRAGGRRALVEDRVHAAPATPSHRAVQVRGIAPGAVQPRRAFAFRERAARVSPV